MTKELIERITTKLFFIEKEAAQIRAWLENGTDKDLVFLADMNATSTNDAEPQAEYGASMIVDAPPSITDLEGVEMTKEQYKAFTEMTATPDNQPSNLKNKEVLIERFGLEEQKRGEILDSNDEKFIKLCNWVISSGASIGKVSEFLFGKNLAITSQQEEHLEQLRKTRRAMLAKDMDLQAAKDQNGISIREHAALETLAKENGLK
jgi:hypothetical protein